MPPRAEWRWWALAGAAALLLTPCSAQAYIGPGGGLSLLTTALAMLAAFSVSTVVVVMWPIRAFQRWLRRRRGQAEPVKPDDREPEQ